MPEELEPYRDLINNTGGNEIEGLINDYLTDNKLMRTNVVRFTLAAMVYAQIQLLMSLHAKGLLR